MTVESFGWAAANAKFTAQPRIEASLRTTIGNAYADLSVLPEAELQYRRAVELRRRVLGPEHRDTLMSTARLGELLRYQGRFAEAESLDGKLLEERRRALGTVDPDTLSTMSELAQVYNSEGRSAQAEKTAKEAMDALMRIVRLIIPTRWRRWALWP